MERMLRGWMVAGLLLGTMTYAIAEDVTLTTYYPSPRGVYDQLKSNQSTRLAISGGNVVIGEDSAGSAKLDVKGSVLVRNGTFTIQNTGGVVIASGTPGNGKVLTAIDSNGTAEWRDPVYAP